MTGPAIRASGTWTTYRGEPRRVSGRVDGETVALKERGRPGLAVERVAASEVGEVVKVVTRAVWRDGAVIVADQVAPGRWGFLTDDAALARREDLEGDQHSGWRGTASEDELTDVREDRTVVRGEGTDR